MISNPNNRWYESREALLGEEYFLHAFGSFYVVSGRSVDKWIVPNAHMLRKLSNECMTFFQVLLKQYFCNESDHTSPEAAVSQLCVVWSHLAACAVNAGGCGTQESISQAGIKVQLCADISVGMWMLMFNSTFFEDRRLCHRVCDRSAIAVMTPACQGLCNPLEDMRSCHQKPACTDPRAPAGEPMSLPATADGDALTDGSSQQQQVQQALDTAPQKAQEKDSDWLNEVLWKLRPAPWHRHEIFGKMQEVIDAPANY